MLARDCQHEIIECVWLADIHGGLCCLSVCSNGEGLVRMLDNVWSWLSVLCKQWAPAGALSHSVAGQSWTCSVLRTRPTTWSSYTAIARGLITYRRSMRRRKEGWDHVSPILPASPSPTWPTWQCPACVCVVQASKPGDVPSILVRRTWELVVLTAQNLPVTLTFLQN